VLISVLCADGSIYIYKIIIIIIIIYSGSAAQHGLWPPRPRGFLITHNDAPHSVGILWTSDHLVAENSTWQHTQQTNIHAAGGIRTHVSSRRAAVDLRLRLCLLCGAGCYPPNVLQPTEAYCTNLTLVSPFNLQRRFTLTGVRDLYKHKVELWARNVRSNLAYNCDFHGNCRVLLQAAQLRHGTDGFTSPPKEGMLRIFFRPKNPAASAGFEPANLGNKDHRSR
jgi:hypothetical protein